MSCLYRSSSQSDYSKDTQGCIQGWTARDCLWAMAFTYTGKRVSEHVGCRLALTEGIGTAPEFRKDAVFSLLLHSNASYLSI